MSRTSLLGIAAGLLLSGCSLLPAPPTANQSSAAQAGSSTARPSSNDASNVPVRGFTAYEQAALRVRNIGCQGVATGSGFAIDDHTFVTNRHVIGGAALLQVSTYDGHDIQVTTTGAAVIADLAVVRTAESLPAAIRLASTDPPVGAAVTAVGYPLGGQLTTTHGHVLGYSPDPIGWSPLPMLRNDAPIQHGSSGSPLLDNQGRLVGVVYATSGSSSQFAVPVEVLKNLLNNPASFDSSANCDGVLPTSTNAEGIPCSATVAVGPKTSCPFGLNVESAWRDAGGGSVTVEAGSPVTGKTYTMTCVDGAPVVCTGGNDARVYITP